MTDLNAFLPYVNGPLGFLFRHALWIPDRRHKIARIDPNAYHLALGDGAYRAVLHVNAQHSEAAYKNLGWFMRGAHAFDMAQPALNFGFDTFSEQPDGTDGIDTMIIQENPTTSYGNTEFIYIGENYGSAQLCRGLIKFDLSQLPPLYVVPSSANLSLWSFADQSNNARTFRVYRQLRAWVETEATWNVYSTGNNWQTSGGFGSNDCEQTQCGSRDFTATESNGEKQFSLNVVKLEDMCNGLFTNNGWMIKNDVEDNDQYRFRSSDYVTTASERPKLEFTYYPQDSGGLLL